MKRMTKLTSISLGLIVILLSQVSFGQRQKQQGPPPHPNDKQIKKMVDDLSAELKLTKDQKKQVLGIYVAHFNEVNERTKAGKPDRRIMQSLEVKLDGDVKALLTKEQKKQYETYRKETRPGPGRK